MSPLLLACRLLRDACVAAMSGAPRTQSGWNKSYDKYVLPSVFFLAKVVFYYQTFFGTRPTHDFGPPPPPPPPPPPSGKRLQASVIASAGAGGSLRRETLSSFAV